MNRFLSAFILSAALLSAIGCASYDDTAERIEFEKLRAHPVTPQGDRILPVFESAPSSDDSQGVAVLPTSRSSRK